MSDARLQSLLTPFALNDLLLPNRIVMAPLTRMRAVNAGRVPTELHAAYYAQRASAGLIISEGVFVSPASYGWAHVPGLWSDEQVQAWRPVTEAVHKAGGRIFAQLWHTGAMSHPDLLEGAQPVSASDVNLGQQAVTAEGKKDTVAPRPMSKAEIRETVADFGRAAKNAVEAGFDGVQIQGGYLYLFNQFLQTTTNRRTDEYGGSVENRARFLFEVLETVADAVGANRVGMKTGPATLESGALVSNEDTLPTAEFVIGRLNHYGLSHLLLMGAMADLSGGPIAHLAGDGMFRHFRELYHGHVIANVGLDPANGARLITEGLVDLVAFGRPFIANPDLPARIAAGAPLVEPDWATVYGPTAQGYTDYPPLELVTS